MEAITREAIFEEVRQRLGPLNNQAQQAITEVLEMLKLPEKRQNAKAKKETFVGENVSVAQYEAWSRDERLEYQTRPEKMNVRWIKKKLKDLRAMWIMVVDGRVVKYGSLTNYPTDEVFDALCEKYDKFPFVFLNPQVLNIEETGNWHDTIVEDDAFPTVSVVVQSATGRVELDADFDTGALGVYFDQEYLLKNRVLKRRDRDIENVSEHLGKSYRFIQRPLWLEITDIEDKTRRIGMIALCIEDCQSSPFVVINPTRTALVGREIFLKLQPIVHLNFAQHQTEIEYLP